MSEKIDADKKHNVLAEMADQDVEQPGDTPSDVPPNVEDAEDHQTEATPKAAD